MQLDKQSSPGWPLCQQKPTIGEWLFGPGLFPIKEQAEKLWMMVNSVIAGDYTHVYKIFVKAEPHTQRKIHEKRWRLIMMSSLPVQVTWHMLLGHLAERMLEPFKTPLAHGLVYFGGGWKLFNHYIEQHRLNWTADKTGWDWNSPGWVYEASKSVIMGLTYFTGVVKVDSDWTFDSDDDSEIFSKVNEESTLWKKTLDRLFRDAFITKRVVLPDNTILQQLNDGLMPSGCVWTIQLNGMSQLALHVLALIRMNYSPSRSRLLATGDDTIQEMPPDLDREQYVRNIQQAGCVIKECGEGRDFMGFEITSNGFFPKYVEKHIETLKLQKTEYLQESLEGYLRIYCFDSQMYDFWRNVAHQLGFRMPSRRYFLYFANHPDALEQFTIARPSFGDRNVSGDVVV